MLAEIPDAGKYESLVFPEADIWGLVMPEDDKLAVKKAIHVDDLIGLPLFCSGQGWEKDIPLWAKGMALQRCEIPQGCLPLQQEI